MERRPPGVALGLLAHPLQALAALFTTAGNPLDAQFKQQYWFQLLAPLAFLPLASPGTLLAALPVLFEHFLSSRLAQLTIRSQYTALVTPFVAAAAIVGFGNLTRRLARGRRARLVAGRGDARPGAGGGRGYEPVVRAAAGSGPPTPWERRATGSWRTTTGIWRPGARA